MYSNWKIDRTSETPLYAQIASLIERDIRDGVLRPGTRLPSHRSLMELFLVSRNTVIGALDRLVKDGLIVVIPQSGVRVAGAAQSSVSRKGPDWNKYFKNGMHRFGSVQRLEQLTVIGRATGRVINISAAGLGSDFNLLGPVTNLIEKKVLKKDLKTLTHFNKYGYRPLRQAIAERVASHGIKVTENEILIVPSVLQGINIACMAFTGFGSNFIYERPNVINMDSIIHYMGSNMVQLPMDENGIAPDKLEQALKVRNSVLYLNPTSHNPTGYTMPVKRRREILRLANHCRVPVMEVDSLRDIWIDKPFPPSLRALDTAGSVIYFGSVLRTLTFNLGISWVIACREVIERLSDVKAQSDIYPSLILQLIAEELLREGHYDRFLNDIRPMVAGKRADALSLIKKYFGDIATWNEEDCKLYFWIKFDKRINTRKLFEQIRGVEFYPGFFFDKSDTSHISIFPSGLSSEELEEGLSLLNKAIRRLFRL